MRLYVSSTPGSRAAFADFELERAVLDQLGLFQREETGERFFVSLDPLSFAGPHSKVADLLDT